MEWRDLRPEVQDTLAECWSVGHPRRYSVTRQVGKEFCCRLCATSWGGGKGPIVIYRFTEESYQQTLAYQSECPAFDIKREGDAVTYTGREKLGEVRA